MNRHQRGYTLIELMISLLLGLMLIAGFGSLFVQTQKNATTQRSLSYMMEDGRYILEIFGRELRRAGSLRSKLDANGGAGTVFTANPTDTADTNVLGSTMSFSVGDYIRGEYNAAGFGATADKPYNVNRMVLRYQISDSNELKTGGLGSTNSACERSILLAAGEDPATQVHVVTVYFYVAFDATTNTPVLYCVANRRNFTDRTKDQTSPAEPLISNVQQLLITYGIDSDADSAADYYTGAGNVTNWQQVVAAKLSVVLRSDDNNLTQSSVSYSVDGTSYTATDKRLYRAFSTTVAFRNEL